MVNKENKNSRDFSGILSDEQVKEVLTNEFSRGKTVLAVALTVGILVAGMAIIIGLSGGIDLGITSY